MQQGHISYDHSKMYGINCIARMWSKETNFITTYEDEGGGREWEKEKGERESRERDRETE